MTHPAPYANYDREIHAVIQAIWKETPDLRVVSDFVRYLPVEIVASKRHPERVGLQGYATSCGLLEGALYVAVNFTNPQEKAFKSNPSQIFFLPEVKFLRHARN